MAKVAIVIGSISDKDVVMPAYDILRKYGVEVEFRVMSAHRTPHIAATFADGLIKNGFEVVIAAAGKAAHLAGVIAGHTTLPVIGLPIKSSTMDGLDSLLSVVQMPNGIPVATVAINGGLNAGILALQILSIKYQDIAVALVKYKKTMEEGVMSDDAKLAAELAGLNK